MIDDEWERRVARIWCEVLQTERAPESDVNFFDAGGTSVMLLRVRTLLAATYGIEVRGVDLFTHATIERLARHLARTAA